MEVDDKPSALDAVHTSRAPALAKAMMRYGVTDGDPLVEVVRIAVDADAARSAATDAANAAARAAAQVATSVTGIQDAIYQGAAKASADVKASVEASIAGTIKNSLDQSVQAGAAALRQAAADLPKVGRENQAQILAEWRAALAAAARDQGLAGTFQRLSVNIAIIVILLASMFLGGMYFGARGIVYLMNYKHRLTPHGWQLLVNKSGKPLCGDLGNRQVCLARHFAKR